MKLKRQKNNKKKLTTLHVPFKYQLYDGTVLDILYCGTIINMLEPYSHIAEPYLQGVELCSCTMEPRVRAVAACDGTLHQLVHTQTH